MPENLVAALQITLIGMSLVFGAILLLWGVMAVLVRLAADKPEAEETFDASKYLKGFDDLQRRAAIAAVAVALAQAQAAVGADRVSAHPPPPTAIVSAWQAVRRAQQLKQRGPTR
jgi:Na+-transporting methylmalonyl-CoA/oxaloacetate decarboxylase gamma subunit